MKTAYQIYCMVKEGAVGKQDMNGDMYWVIESAYIGYTGIEDKSSWAVELRGYSPQTSSSGVYLVEKYFDGSRDHVVREEICDPSSKGINDAIRRHKIRRSPSMSRLLRRTAEIIIDRIQD